MCLLAEYQASQVAAPLKRFKLNWRYFDNYSIT